MRLKRQLSSKKTWGSVQVNIIVCWLSDSQESHRILAELGHTNPDLTSWSRPADPDTLTYMGCVPQGDVLYNLTSHVSCTARAPLSKRGKCTLTNTHTDRQTDTHGWNKQAQSNGTIWKRLQSSHPFFNRACVISELPFSACSGDI